MRVSRLAGLCSLLFFIIPDPMSRGDWLYFARGGQAELPAFVAGSVVRVATPTGDRSFPLDAFRSIVPGGRLDDEWEGHRRAAERDGSAQARFAAAWWGLEHGLTPEAIALLRAAASAPGAEGHAPLLRASRMLDRLDAPVAEGDDSPIRRRFTGDGWVEARGRHVVLLHQGNPVEAAERLDVLDRVVDTFYLGLAAQGLADLIVPGQRLVSVWFARQDDYVAFLRTVEAGPFATTQGYYHPTWRVVFAFDTRSSPDQAGPRAAIERRSNTGGLTPADRADLDRQSLLLDLRWRAVDLGIAAHETVHQLAAASGLAPDFDDFPHWLHEGFAAQFEVVRGGRWAGFGRANDLRLPDWRSAHPAPEIAPLLRDDDLAHGYRRDRYAEAWALVYFLRKTRPTEFATFLRLLQTPRNPNQPAPAQSAFVAAFGADLGALQRDWRRFMRDQQTPLEAHARQATVAKSP